MVQNFLCTRHTVFSNTLIKTFNLWCVSKLFITAPLIQCPYTWIKLSFIFISHLLPNIHNSAHLNGLGGRMLKRVFSSIFLILFRPPDTVLAFSFLVLLWSVGNSMSPGRSGMEKRLPFFSWILGMWGPPFFFSCMILLRSSLKTRCIEVEKKESLSKKLSTLARNILAAWPRVCVQLFREHTCDFTCLHITCGTGRHH